MVFAAQRTDQRRKIREEVGYLEGQESSDDDEGDEDNKRPWWLAPKVKKATEEEALEAEAAEELEEVEKQGPFIEMFSDETLLSFYDCRPWTVELAGVPLSMFSQATVRRSRWLKPLQRLVGESGASVVTKEAGDSDSEASGGSHTDTDEDSDDAGGSNDEGGEKGKEEEEGEDFTSEVVFRGVHGVADPKKMCPTVAEMAPLLAGLDAAAPPPPPIEKPAYELPQGEKSDDEDMLEETAKKFSGEAEAKTSAKAPKPTTGGGGAGGSGGIPTLPLSKAGLVEGKK